MSSPALESTSKHILDSKDHSNDDVWDCDRVIDFIRDVVRDCIRDRVGDRDRVRDNENCSCNVKIIMIHQYL